MALSNRAIVRPPKPGREEFMGARHVWPKEGIARVPYWVYSDPEIYAREQERIFCGASWSYVALDAELPSPGDFKRTFIGEKPVVVVRDREGSVNVVENRCAHRASSSARSTSATLPSSCAPITNGPMT